MSENNLNIKSSTVEKGFDLIKGFAQKLIDPTIEEVGLLISDNVKYYRFKNQVKILSKAKKYIDKNDVNIKQIPIKILVPLLENASLEENEDLQDKWSNMIVNLADSETNLQNQIFPHLLNQISIEEYNSLSELLKKERVYWKKHSEWFKLSKLEGNKYFNSSQEFKNLSKYIEEVKQEGFVVSNDFTYELANMERLGLIKRTPPKIIIEEFKTGESLAEYNQPEEWHQPEAKYDDLELNTYRITELGFSFIEICELKKEAK